MAEERGRPRRILVFGAHPDDCDGSTGGTAAKWVRAGHVVQFVSLTNGSTGHQQMGGSELARRRAAEAKAAGEVLGVDYLVLDTHSGALEATLERRREVIRLIRGFRPDLILGPRPWDYHPDHRYTGVLVQDSAYVVSVPGNEPLTPALERNPHFMYVSDGFKKPYPFTPDVIVDIDDVVEQKIRALSAHTSQMYEWLPYHAGTLDQVPPAQDEAARLEWLGRRLRARYASVADRFRDLLIRWYGEERGRNVGHAEAFETCEYGAPLGEERLRELFPFHG
jgi:LmbE family N-acetylglucosaminyl deacetylase